MSVLLSHTKSQGPGVRMPKVVYAVASDQIADPGCTQFPLSPLPSSQISFFSSGASLVGAGLPRRQAVGGRAEGLQLMVKQIQVPFLSLLLVQLLGYFMGRRCVTFTSTRACA